MRLLSFLFYFSTVAAVASLSWNKPAQHVLDSGHVTMNPKTGSKVPGNSPATYCSNPETDIFNISYLLFYPGHPKL
jgi:hypothetical protein